MRAPKKPYLLQEATLSFVTLDREGRSPLHRQLYREIRRGVLRRLVHPGARIPPTRTLAEELGVSRNTVTNAVDQLVAEGFLEARVGDGTYVCERLPESMPAVVEQCRDREEEIPLPERVKFWAGLDDWVVLHDKQTQLFRPGAPDLNLFPWRLWEEARSRAMRRRGAAFLHYNEPEGLLDLRELLADHLRETRSLQCDASQIVVCSGSQQGLDLIARVMLDAGDQVAWEDPGYACVARAWRSYRFDMLPMPVDEEGIQPEDGARPKMIYVTPSCQYPTGVPMSLRRRVELLDFARRAGAWIVEDDYDGEFRYSGRPVSSLQGLDGGNRVFYLGTFSKTLHPALRLGYLVVPKSLIHAFRKAKAYSDMMSPYLDQAALTEFLSEGHWHRHVRRMTAVYGRRRKALMEVLRKYPDLFRFEDYGNGMILTVQLPEDIDDRKLEERAAKRGMAVKALSKYFYKRQPRPGLLMGFTAFPEAALQEGVCQLVEMIRKLCPAPRSCDAVGY
jgi:GntR family transcriptional regulator / MocR family aminotransferase